MPGASVACQCEDGTHGATLCDAFGVFEPCRCEPTPDAGVCDPFSVRRCTCADGRMGSVSCGLDGLPGACACVSDGGAPTCTRYGEWCNGEDDDCDGLVDEGHVCPWSSVDHTSELEGSVWIVERARLEEVYPFELRRILPTPTEPEGDIPVSAAGVPYFQLRADGLYYASRLALGVRRHVPGGPASALPTPGCEHVSEFGFDDAGRLHYRCLAGVLREGTRIASAHRLEAVLGSGHLLAVPVEHPLTLALLDPEGTIVSRPPLDAFAGLVMDAPHSATVQGDEAWVAFHRWVHTVYNEIVVFRVSATTGAWDLVRRLDLGTDDATAAVLALPDGRVLRLRAEGSGAERTYRLHEHRADGSAIVHAVTGAHDEVRLLVKPEG